MDLDDVPDVDDREELSDEEISARINDLNIGDKVLFDDRKVPLRVTKKNATAHVSLGDDLTGVEVDGTSVQYILSPDEAMYHKAPGVVRRSINWITKVR